MLTGARVGLRSLEATHRDLYRALWTSPHVMAAIGATLSLEEADAQFDRTLRHDRSPRSGHRTWGIHGIGDGDPVGIIALSRCEGEPRAELGLMLVPRAWRRKVGTEAIALLLPHAWRAMGLESVVASRRDDAHAGLIDGLLAPLGFEQAASLAPGERRWRVSKPVVHEVADTR